MESNENLFAAQKLCMIAQRHLLVASADPVYSVRQLVKFGDLYGVPTKTLVCDAKTSAQELNWLQRVEDSLIFVVRGLERASLRVQVTLLDILRKKEALFSVNNRSNSSTIPFFLVVAVVESIEGNELCLYKYLQEKFWFRQYHVYEPSESSEIPNKDVNLNELLDIRNQIPRVMMIPEIRRYVLDIVVFIRNHRVVAGGIPTRFISEFETMVRCLALVNGYEFVTPVLVKLAARKFFPLRISICGYEEEPSLSWGSEMSLVKSMMSKWNADLVVEDVLSRIRPPI